MHHTTSDDLPTINSDEIAGVEGETPGVGSDGAQDITRGEQDHELEPESDEPYPDGYTTYTDTYKEFDQLTNNNLNQDLTTAVEEELNTRYPKRANRTQSNYKDMTYNHKLPKATTKESSMTMVSCHGNE